MAMLEIPSQLREIINNREDLDKLDYLKKVNERKLIVWVILHGFNEYPKLKFGNVENNNVLKWLAYASSDKSFKNIPKIVLGIWDIFKSHERRWPFPHLNTFYQFWIKKNWKKLGLDLPEYTNLFLNDLNQIGIFNYLIYEILWKIRKPLSLQTKKFFGFNLDFYFAKKLQGWQIQINVVNALVYRELKTRLSEAKFGVVGVFIEPLGTMVLFLFLFSVIRRSRGPLDIILFLGTGILFFTLFSDIAIRSSNAMSANEALFFYKPVKPIDTVIARTLVETGLYGIVYLVILFTVFLIRQKFILNDISVLVQAFIALVIFSFGVGLFLVVATFIYPFLNQIIPLTIRPIWFISGVFISLNQLPQFIRPYIAWNPILQAIEIARHSLEEEYLLNPLISLNYLWSCAVISLFLGLWVYSYNEKRLLTR